MGGLSVCEVLHRVNRALGTEEALLVHAPECILEVAPSPPDSTEPPAWLNEARETIVFDVRDREDFFLPEVLDVLHRLSPQQVLKVVNDFYPAPLIEMLQAEGYDLFYEQPSFHEHRLYVRRPSPSPSPWQQRKATFPEVDSAAWGKDFLSRLVQEAEALPPGQGFRLSVRMAPEPLVNTLESLGLETAVEEVAPGAFVLYGFKPASATTTTTKRVAAPAMLHPVPLVIQSATPVVYPVLMRLLSSKRLMRAIRVQELKVWDKTEKHLGVLQ